MVPLNLNILAPTLLSRNRLHTMLKLRHTEDDHLEAGIDEAGRGCLWGPLVAAAVLLPPEAEWTNEFRSHAPFIKDSKKVTAKRRAILEDVLKRNAVAWAIGRVEATEIDQIGMTAANRLAFQRALEGLSVQPGRILIDGILGLQETVLKGRIQVVEPQADNLYLSVAAASILAKEGRDRIVKELCEAESTLQDRYGLLTSKGYGTAVHREALKKYGMHEQHRRLFLRKLLGLEHVVSKETYSSSYDFLED